MKCACLSPYSPPSNYKNPTDFFRQLIEKFSEVRNSCSALQLVLPDELFQATRSNYQHFDKAHHESKLVIAFERGILHRITLPLHEFIVDFHGNPIQQLNPSYVKDLKEKWLVAKPTNANDEDVFSNELKKHQVSRIHDGKLHELVFAYALSKSVKIINLDAWDKYSPDILVHDGTDFLAIEVKFVGQKDDYVRNGLTKRGGAFAPDSDANYIVFRLCEASAQLQKYQIQVKRIAVVIVDAMQWHFPELAFNRFGFSFNNTNLSKEKNMFDNLCINKRKSEIEQIQDIFTNSKEYLSKLDGLWIFETMKFDYELKFENGIDCPLKK